MAIEIRRASALPTAQRAPRLPLSRRLYGLGSVFGKTVRDARLAVLLVGGTLVTLVVAGGIAMSTTYGTPETRAELAALTSSLPPVLRGLYGNPVAVDTLGGFIAWHYGAYIALLAGLWSILALSGTLAGEARRGSLDFTLAAPGSRRSVAMEKLGGHLVALSVAMIAVAVATWLTGAVAATFPGDAIAPDAAVAFALAVGLKALLAGAVAWAIAPLLGRGAAAGIAGALMLGGYLVTSYRSVVPAFETLANLTWFGWTYDHLPLAGRHDWAGVGLVGLAAASLLVVGMEVFARRDVSVTGGLRMPGLPRATLGLGGPVRRSFGELLPGTLAWGIGLALYGIVMAASARVFSEELAKSSALAAAVRRLVPGVDVTSVSGFLQYAFIDLGLILVGLAAATFVATRSSDEAAGRMELLLATPLTRVRWAIGSALALFAAVGGVVAFLAGSLTVGVASAGDDPLGAAAGTTVLLLYGAALAGVGIAIGGLIGPRLAAPTVAALAIGTFLLDLLAPMLGLPGWVGDLSLSSHLGQPMLGTWDMPGMVACAALAFGGLAVGAWGMQRRDVHG